MMYHSLIARRSEFGVADSRFGLCFPMAWLSMPSTWTLMHARAPANCGCTCFAVAKRYCRSSRKRHQVGALHPGCSGPIHTKAPGCVGPCRLRSPLPFARAGCEDAGPPRLLPPMRPVSGVGRCSGLLGSGVVPVPRLMRGLQPHNGCRAQGALACMENVPPGALAGALRDRPRTPRLLWRRPGRHGGALRSRVPLPAP